MYFGDTVVDFDRFSEPIAEDSPCGPDCEYDGDFLALSQAIAGKPEQQFGDTVIPAVPPDWRQVVGLALELMARTRDLRVVAWLTLASTHLHGIAPFASGLRLMHSLCERYWDSVHPRIEVDGDIDPYLRMNAISAFSGTEFSGEDRLIQALRGVEITKQPLTLSYRDIEQVYNKAPEAQFTEAQVDSALTDAIAAGSSSVLSIAAANESYLALRALVEDKVSAADMPDLERLSSLLKPVKRAIDRLSAPTSDDGVDAESEGGQTLVDASGRVVSAAGVIQSRDDARRALDRVCEYLERTEPSNPASLFARRAQRLLNMPFLDIMRELSPDSISHLEMLTGSQSQQSE
jgi:type VI secretion system protein ImpA